MNSVSINNVSSENFYTVVVETHPSLRTPRGPRQSLDEDSVDIPAEVDRIFDELAYWNPVSGWTFSTPDRTPSPSFSLPVRPSVLFDDGDVAGHYEQRDQQQRTEGGLLSPLLPVMLLQVMDSQENDDNGVLPTFQLGSFLIDHEDGGDGGDGGGE